MNQPLLESGVSGFGRMVMAIAEGFGDIVDPREFHDDPTFGLGRVGAPIYYTTRNDREDGRYIPIFQTEMDLAAIRAEARNVTAQSSGVQGAIDTLANYTFGPGFKITVQKATRCPRGIAPEVIDAYVNEAQAIIDRFIEQNNFQSDMDRELDKRAREDGEVFLELNVSPSGQIRASFDEPDMVCQPANARQIEDWLRCEDYAKYSPDYVWSWSYGVHNIRNTPDDPLGYHVVYDTTGTDWDYVDAKRMLHIKRNVPRNVKRGVSDLYWVANDVQREAKIRRNTADGAALQAAIAWVREFATGTTSAAVTDLTTGNTLPGRPQRTSAGTKPGRNGKLNSGTVVDIPANMKFLPGPMGSERNANFILIAQYVARAIAQRWSMPEFMFTSDASNANYASTMVSESPFVKAREADQRFYAAAVVQLMWKVLRLAKDIGKAFCQIDCFEELQDMLTVTATGPRVSVRDELQAVQRQKIEVDMGTLSLETAAAEQGRDLKKEIEKGARPAVAPTTAPAAEQAPPAQPGGEMLGLNMQQIRRIQVFRDRWLAEYRAGKMDETTLRHNLDALGIPADKIDAYLDSDPTNDPVDPLTEALSDLEVTPAVNAGRDFPSGVPTQEQIIVNASKRLDALFDELEKATIRKAGKAELRRILEQIEVVKGQAVLAAEICGALTPFKPSLQDAQSAEQAPVDPLAVVVKEVPDEAKE